MVCILLPPGVQNWRHQDRAVFKDINKKFLTVLNTYHVGTSMFIYTEVEITA